MVLAILAEAGQPDVSRKLEHELRNAFQTLNHTNFENHLTVSRQLSPSGSLIMRCMSEPRNRIWVKKILKSNPEKRTLYVVGYFHLVGPNNLLQLLSDAGYSVKSITFAEAVR